MRLNKLIQKIKNESGQSIILISVIILSFLMFFVFAINTGFLIAAKISLQNAADAAAYAGAATQARQLNAISYLNYDMRRQYKKFLFRYNFVSSIGNPSYPNNAPSDASNPEYDFPKWDYSDGLAKRKLIPIKVPVICIPLTTKGTPNDNCLQVNLPNTEQEIKDAFGPSGGLTQITKALLQQVQQIQAVQNNICAGQGQINLFVLMAWLFRGDITEQSLKNTIDTVFASGTANITQQDKDQALNTLKALVNGLGLFPRNLITLMRIETLEGFLNQAAQTEVSVDKVTAWEKSQQEAERYERTILAYKSAVANLNSSVMNPSDVVMTELENANQFQLDPIQVDFNAYIQMMANSNQTYSNGATICNAKIMPFPVKSAPVGIKRLANPPVTHYAVKLKAKAKLWFFPAGLKEGLELEAVAGAKPFGSRVGPANIGEIDFIDPNRKPTALPITGEINDCSGNVKCKSPNLKLGGSKTYYSKDYLKTLVDIAKSGSTSFGFAGIDKAQYHSEAPSPIEVGKYNILPPAKSQAEMNYEFIPLPTSDSPVPHIYRFYAPLFPGGGGSPSQRIQQFLDKMFSSTAVGSNDFGFNEQDMRANLMNTMNQYISKLESATGTENQETLTFAAIELPMRQPTTMQKKPEFWLTEANQVLSSWSRSGTPRFGYSVKFVTLQNLTSPQVGMADTDGDLEKVSH